MRQASTTMSWLAEQKATSAASASDTDGRWAGSDKASSAAAMASAGWMTASQPRRRPKWRSGPGGEALSRMGAQRNFSE